MELGIPVSGGNVSFYNQTGDTPILPTPVVGVLGVIDNVEQTIGHALPDPADSTVQRDFKLLLLGATHDEFGGSVWQEVSGQKLSGLPPQVDLANEQRLAEFFADSEGISAAHDLSEGGLAQAVFEMLLGSGKGAELDVTGVHDDAFTALFSESASRVLVAVTADRLDIAVQRATEAGIPVAVLGSTNETGEITVAGETVSIAQLAEAWSATLPGLFDHALAPNAPV